MRNLVWLCFWLLVVLHHDFWLWQEEWLLLGFLPVGLAWHVGFSIASAALWLAAMRYAWPAELEQWASENESTHPQA